MIHSFFVVVAFVVTLQLLDFFRGKIRALHVIRTRLQGRSKKSLIFRSYKLKSLSITTIIKVQKLWVTCNCAEKGKALFHKKGSKKYLQPLLMTIRVICSLL